MSTDIHPSRLAAIEKILESYGETFDPESSIITKVLHRLDRNGSRSSEMSLDHFCLQAGIPIGPAQGALEIISEAGLYSFAPWSGTGFSVVRLMPIWPADEAAPAEPTKPARCPDCQKRREVCARQVADVVTGYCESGKILEAHGFHLNNDALSAWLAANLTEEKE